MSNVNVDPATVLQRLLSGGGVGAMYAEIAMRDVALDDAHARIAILEAAAEQMLAKVVRAVQQLDAKVEAALMRAVRS